MKDIIEIFKIIYDCCSLGKMTTSFNFFVLNFFQLWHLKKVGCWVMLFCSKTRTDICQKNFSSIHVHQLILSSSSINNPVFLSFRIRNKNVAAIHAFTCFLNFKITAAFKEKWLRFIASKKVCYNILAEFYALWQNEKEGNDCLN